MLLVLLMAAAWVSAHAAGEGRVPLTASWMPAVVGEGASTALQRHGAHVFDPTKLAVLPRGSDGVWVRLQPLHGQLPDGPLLLVAGMPALGPVTFFPASGKPERNAVYDLSPGRRHGFDSLVFTIPESQSRSAPLLLRLDAYNGPSPPMTFSVVRPDTFHGDDTRRMLWATASFATMMVTSLFALLFAMQLRDRTFVFYAVYVLGYVVIQAVQSGYVFYPLGIAVPVEHVLFAARVSVGLSTTAAILFLERFVGLRSIAPGWRRVLLMCAAGLFTLALMDVSHVAALERLARALINPALMLAAVLMLAVTIVALWRRSRYALYFLLGWAPLLVFTVLNSAQASGALSGWVGLGLACIVVGAYESVMLSLGMADRALALRHDRDVALVQAQTDDLTQLLNRRAWVARLELLMEQAHRQQQSLAVLFLDLDHFKRLNDALGHQAGDRALVAMADCMRGVLRPGDVIGRYGGEEFTVVLPNCTREYATQVSERLRRALDHADLTRMVDAPPLTVSIGVAMMALDDTLESLLMRADQAMYGAKASGRNRVEFAH